MTAEVASERKSKMSPEDEALQAFRLVRKIQSFIRNISSDNYPQQVVDQIAQDLHGTFERHRQSMTLDAQGQFAILQIVHRGLEEDSRDKAYAIKRLNLFGFKPNEIDTFIRLSQSQTP